MFCSSFSPTRVPVFAIGFIAAIASLWQGVLPPVFADDPKPTGPEKPLVQPGDRVVFIGSGWVERMHHHPWLETMLTLQVPGVTFRNLGWSGDTVHGDARAVFGARADGYQRLMRDLDFAAPKLVIVSYGENEAFGGEAERAEFLAGYHKLIEDLKRNETRVVLVIPRLRERAGKGFPDPTTYNQNLMAIATEIRKLAKEHDVGLIDLEKFAPEERFTTDSVAWNDTGYRSSAREMMRQIGITSLASDRLTDKNPEAVEVLTQKIKAKNEWFFHRYRPQNETYLFLFRKHEQGNNAPEVEQMEQFVRDGEESIGSWLIENNAVPRNQ